VQGNSSEEKLIAAAKQVFKVVFAALLTWEKKVPQTKPIRAPKPFMPILPGYKCETVESKPDLKLNAPNHTHKIFNNKKRFENRMTRN
jgi:hypothetical protein